MSAREPHIALDAEIVRFREDGSPVWQPRIIKRFDDGRTEFIRPAIYQRTWIDAIQAANAYLVNPTEVF